MKTYLILIATFIYFAGFSQEKQTFDKKEFVKKQWEVDLLNTGVGLELFKPNFGDDANALSTWRGVQALLGPFTIGFSQGLSNERTELTGYHDYLKPPFTDTTPTTRFDIGANIPIPFLTFGSFISYKKVLRGHPFASLSFGMYTLRTGGNNNSQNKKKAGLLNLGLGYRIRLPYSSIDFNLKSELSRGAFTIYPAVVFRFDGLFDRFTPTYRSVGATNFSYSKSTQRTTSRTQTTQGTRITIRETSTYTVSSSPSKVSVMDIGTYFGIGLRYSQSIINQRHFSNVGHLFGINGLVRSGPFIFGANLELGKIGHGSMSRYTTSSGEYKFYRQVKKTEDIGKGTYNTLNFLVDAGLNFNNFLMALAGTIVDDEESTSFVSFNAGYSFGFNFLWNQQFDNPNSDDYYDNFFFPENNYFNDPRESKGGYLGAWFISCDVGHASLRAQWYRYRRAPLANGLMFSISWRFG